MFASQVRTVVKGGLVSIEPYGIGLFVHQHLHGYIIRVLARHLFRDDHVVISIGLAGAAIGHEGESVGGRGPAGHVHYS